LAYDAMNRLTTITYPSSPATTTQFRLRFARAAHFGDRSKTGNITTYAYDDADRLNQRHRRATPGNVTTYAYDTESNLTSITTPRATRRRSLTTPLAG